MAFGRMEDMQFSLGSLQDEMNHLLERIWHAGVSTGPFDGQQWAPVIDLYEHGDFYTLYAEVPGVDPGSVDVSYVGRALTIRGEKAKPAGAGAGGSSLRRERRFGTFCRTVELPADIEADKLSARCQGGVLEITIPKSEASRPKSVKIQVEED